MSEIPELALTYDFTLPPGWLVVPLDEESRLEAEGIIGELGEFAVRRVEDRTLRSETRDQVRSHLHRAAERARELGGQQMLLQIAGAFGTFQASSCIVARKGTVLDPDELDLVTLEVLAARDLSEDGDLVTVARVRGVDGAVRVVAPQDPDVQERVDAQYFVPIPSTSDVLIFTFEMRLGLQRDDALRLFDAIVDTLRFIDGTRLRGEGDADG